MIYTSSKLDLTLNPEFNVIDKLKCSTNQVKVDIYLYE